MMKRKLFACIIALVLLVSQSACSDVKNTVANNAAPNYIVKDITESLGLKAPVSMKMNSQNQLVIYDNSDGSNRYVTVDAAGKIINEIKCDFKGYGQAYALDKDNNLYILAQDCVMEENGYKIIENTRELLVFNSKGEKLKSVELGKVALKNDEEIYIRSISIDPNGNIYLVKYNETPELIDRDGKPLKNSISGVCGFMDFDENGNILLGATGAKGTKPYIACMDPKNGKELWKKELDVGIYISSICYNPADKALYAVTNKGVDKYDSKGDLSGTVLDLMKYNLLQDEASVSGMCVDSSGSLYIIINGMESVQIKKFEIGDATQADNNSSNTNASNANASNPNKSKEKKVITLAAHFSDRWLESAVSTFQNEHPNIEISVKDYKGAYYGGSDTPEEADKRQEEFVKTINTEMMAGKGPDIVYFCGLPYRKYIDKNMFANLSELMEKDSEFNTAELNMNILDAMKYKGGLYVMPVNYQFELMLANKSVLDKEIIKIDDRNWTWNDFMQIAEKVTKDTNNDGAIDQYATYSRGKTGIFYDLFEDSYGKFIDVSNKKADFTGSAFISLLEASKAFKDNKLLYEASDYGKVKDMASRGGIAFMDAGITGYDMVNYYKSNVFGTDVYMLRKPADNTAGNRKIIFDVVNMFAINNNTKYRDEAWQFLKLLLSKKQQASPSMQNGFPVNNEALKELAAFNVKYLYMNQKLIDAIDEFIPDVGDYKYEEEQINSIIGAEVSDFLAGKRSAEETAKIIQNKVAIILNEQG
ncbi:MAG TPA: extracellular solute-binding protein [Clostridia bacterium]|nr:extracellular solute-binding protein [Clostridia bacterium]